MTCIPSKIGFSCSIYCILLELYNTCTEFRLEMSRTCILLYVCTCNIHKCLLRICFLLWLTFNGRFVCEEEDHNAYDYLFVFHDVFFIILIVLLYHIYWSVSKEFFVKEKMSGKKILRKEKDAKKAKKNIPWNSPFLGNFTLKT